MCRSSMRSHKNVNVEVLHTVAYSTCGKLMGSDSLDLIRSPKHVLAHTGEDFE
jgi:hypothetical protein